MKEKERKRDLDFERFLLTNPIYNVRMFVRIGNNEEEFDKFYSIETFATPIYFQCDQMDIPINVYF